MNFVRITLGKMGLALALICATMSVLAQGGRVSPALDLLTQVAPFYLGGSIFSGVLALLGLGAPRNVVLILASVGSLAAIALMAPEILRNVGPQGAPGSPGEIKVIQFNAWRENRHPDGIARWLQAEKPDLVLLEEATPALRDAIIARTGWSVAGAKTTDMIFSHARYLEMRRPTIAGKQSLTWVNATYDTGGGPFEVVVTNMAWPTEMGRMKQSAVLGAVLSTRPRERMVLAGDFNSTPWSFRRQRDDNAFGLIRRDRAVATWPTGHSALWPWPAPFPFLPIDHVYAGPGWATTSVRRGPRLGSDHYPLIVTLAPATR